MKNIVTKIGAVALILAFLFTAFAATDVSADDNNQKFLDAIIITDEDTNIPKGCDYDPVSRVLTINNVTLLGLEYRLNDKMLTLVVEGNCVFREDSNAASIDTPGITASGIKITGNGTLTIIKNMGIQKTHGYGPIENSYAKMNLEIDGLAHLKIVASDNYLNKDIERNVGIGWDGYGDVVINNCPDVKIYGYQTGIYNGEFIIPIKSANTGISYGNIWITNSKIDFKWGTSGQYDKAVVASTLGRIYCDTCIGNADFYVVDHNLGAYRPVSEFKSGEISVILTGFDQDITLGTHTSGSVIVIAGILVMLALIAFIAFIINRKTS